MFSIQKLSALLLGAAVFACTGENPTDVSTEPTERPVLEGIATLVMVPDSVAVSAGESVQLMIYGRTIDGDSVGVVPNTLSWSTSDSRVATVAASGLVTGGAEGSVTIKAMTGAVTAAARVKVAAGAPTSETHAGWHVSPNGTPQATGTKGSPWSLSHALDGAAGRIQPGDTVWLHGGTYRGRFVATVAGAAGRPVVIRQYPGERATIDAAGGTSSSTREDAFVVKGEWTEWWDFELMSSDPNRHTDARPNMVVNNASNTKYVDLIVHDGGIGFFNYPSRSNVEVSGSIFYNNGWQGPLKGGGHAMYLKSYTGPVVVRDNVAFNQFGYGIHVYTDAGAGALVNIQLDGNVSFNNGAVTEQYSSTPVANILVGGEEPVKSNKVLNNMTYFSPGMGMYNVLLGYADEPAVDVSMSNNYFVGGQHVLTTGQWDRITATGNQLFGSGGMVRVKDKSHSGYNWSGNTYQREPSAAAWQYDGTDYTLASWKSTTGLGKSDVATSSRPSSAKVFVRPSVRQKGRAMVVVYNWGTQSSVNVDLGSVLPAGSRYEVRNVQSWFGSPVKTGTFSGGSIAIPMGGVAPPSVVGGAPHTPPRTGPDFDVFIVQAVK
jgi:hypothetical protein